MLSLQQREGEALGEGAGAPAPPPVYAGHAAMDTTAFSVSLLAWGGRQTEVPPGSSSSAGPLNLVAMASRTSSSSAGQDVAHRVPGAAVITGACENQPSR
jgi:hypothetical protein